MKKILFIFLISFFCYDLISKDIEVQIREDLRLYKDIMDYFIMDDGYYPEVISIDKLAKEILKRQYAEDIKIKDPHRRFYKVNSNKNHYRISTEDGFYQVEIVLIKTLL